MWERKSVRVGLIIHPTFSRSRLFFFTSSIAITSLADYLRGKILLAAGCSIPNLIDYLYRALSFNILIRSVEYSIEKAVGSAMADISNPRPIVNSKGLKNYTGRRVTTVVKVLKLEGGTVAAEMPDGAAITVKQAPQHVAAQSTFMEVIGVVESDRFLRAEACTSFGDNFDMSTYNELCNLANGENRDCFV